ncbi:major facilitator superfamily transporter [Secundilactobacillus pentosiphilus]|uniref:Major facilitator superfamily transporter n=1 Tax=Secundilactobacillus pentosiphilus TaxID=1714682 RepID=A0A1Z5IPK7_9LACO|nr:DHA2 family efflux MFS transporter permease subunit [Secundilactobacillus pentosiphilus]GAX03680.1 major facilitator superfamily transporter [Secundilactobacillus pentosiphilus]
MQNQAVSRKTMLAIVGAGLLAFCGVLVETSMNVTFPTLMKQFNLSMSVVQWLSTGYLLLVSLTMATSAYIQRRYKIRSIFIFAGLSFIVGSFVCGLAPNFMTLLIGRLIQAVATGYAIPLLFAIILQQIPVARLGLFMGIGGMVVGVAPSIGPTYGGMNTYLFSWREIFWFILPVVVIAVLLGSFTITQKIKTRRDTFDLFGLILLGISFFLVAEGFTEAGNFGWLSSQFWGFLIAGLVVMALFVYHSFHSDRDLLDLSIFKSPTFVLSIMAYFLIQLMNIGISYLLPNYSQLVFGANSLAAGAAILLGSLVSGIVQPISGRLLDSHGAGYPIRIGSTLIVIAMLLFAIFGLHLTIPLIVFFYLIFGLGFGFSFGNVMTNGIKQVDDSLQQDANAAFNTSQQYAGSIGTAIMAAILTSSQHSDSHLSQAVLSARGGHHDFILLAVLAMTAFVLILINFQKQAKNAKA